MSKLEARARFKVFRQEKSGAPSEDLVDMRWALTWKEVYDEKTARARLAAKGCQDPDPRTGNVDIAGCVSRRPSHVQLISLGALKKWPPWRLDIRNAFPGADGFDRAV